MVASGPHRQDEEGTNETPYGTQTFKRVSTFYRLHRTRLLSLLKRSILEAELCSPLPHQAHLRKPNFSTTSSYPALPRGCLLPHS